jgi:glycosyltransferase involved in cell wall biosynthesis
MRVTHFERMPVSGGYSIERLFKTIRPALPSDCPTQVVRCPTPAHSRFWLPWGIVKAFRAEGDVNHITGDIHYIALGLRGSRSILTVHDVHRLLELKGLRKAVYRWLYFSWPMRRCAVVTAISSHTKDRLIQMFPFVSKKIQVIPDCLPAGFRLRPRAFNAQCPRILQIGTAPNKNLDRVIEAVSGRACILHVIGRLTDEHRSALQEKKIDYENDVDLDAAELIRAYEKSDLVIFVSLAEGFGMPIIEAQAIGRPVITSRLPPMQEVAGAGALFADPFRVEEIRSAVDRIIQDADCRTGLVDAGLKNVKRFDPGVVAAQYAELYRRVVERAMTRMSPSQNLL